MKWIIIILFDYWNQLFVVIFFTHVFISYPILIFKNIYYFKPIHLIQQIIPKKKEFVHKKVIWVIFSLFCFLLSFFAFNWFWPAFTCKFIFTCIPLRVQLYEHLLHCTNINTTNNPRAGTLYICSMKNKLFNFIIFRFFVLLFSCLLLSFYKFILFYIFNFQLIIMFIGTILTF